MGKQEVFEETLSWERCGQQCISVEVGMNHCEKVGRKGEVINAS